MLQKFKAILATLIFAFAVSAVASPAYGQTLSDCEMIEAEMTAIELELDSIENDLGSQVDRCTRELAAAEAIKAGLRVDNEELKRALGNERERRIRAEARVPGWKWAVGGAVTGITATVLVFIFVVN